MKIICIGDSLTQGDYGVKGKTGIANLHDKNYPFFLAENTGWSVLNCGRCGYRADNYLNYYKNKDFDVSDADVIVIMLGTNGGNDPDENTPCNQAYKELIKLLRADAPNATIILCTPPQATINKSYSNCGHMPRIQKAVSFAKKLAVEEALPLIDVHNCGRFTPETEDIMQANDGLHFTEIGYKTLALVIEQGIKEIMHNK